MLLKSSERRGDGGTVLLSDLQSKPIVKERLETVELESDGVNEKVALLKIRLERVQSWGGLFEKVDFSPEFKALMDNGNTSGLASLVL